MARKPRAKDAPPKRRSPQAKALEGRQYRHRVIPAAKKRGRARMAEIYAREWRCVESELEL